MGFASLALSFFRADHLTALVVFGLTIGLIVERLGDGNSRGQHDPNNRADDCVIHIAISLVPAPLLPTLSVVADRSMKVLLICRNERTRPASRYRKDVPNAEVHVLDAGHFALDTEADEISALLREFMKVEKQAGRRRTNGN